MAVTSKLPSREAGSGEERLVIFASSLGTVFEWYDFYLYGTLATFFSALFFPPENETAAFLASLATFGAGFAVRPFGALVFGRLGDLIGRKYTFLITIILMGVSTAAVGILPTYAQIGIFAPIILVLLRLVQGLALGGEYGGAATYVAEHAPDNKRGLNTSWIQTTATMGFFLSLLVILLCRSSMSPDAFKAWGWRIPFLVSVVLLGISVYIRLKLQESPVFKRMKSEGKTSKMPLRDAFANPRNRNLMLMSLLGATAGQAVVWYAGQFYALYFLQTILKVDFQTSYILIAIALLLGTPFFIVFGWLSDKIGRKNIILFGMLIALLTYFPIFRALRTAANPALASAIQTNSVTIAASECSAPLKLVFDIPRNDCDKAKDYFTKRGIPYTATSGTGSSVVVTVGATELTGFDALTYDETIKTAGFPLEADPAQMNRPIIVLLLFILVLYVTMVYGPIAAYLVELFPTKVRYTSMSLPYHIGNGWFGGFLPFLALAIGIATGNALNGLWYPIGIAAMSLILGFFFLRDTKGHIQDDF
ncbi:MAG: MFS transporter [Trueperaceae bacterium]